MGLGLKVSCLFWVDKELLEHQGQDISNLIKLSMPHVGE